MSDINQKITAKIQLRSKYDSCVLSVEAFGSNMVVHGDYEALAKMKDLLTGSDVAERLARQQNKAERLAKKRANKDEFKRLRAFDKTASELPKVKAVADIDGLHISRPGAFGDVVMSFKGKIPDVEYVSDLINKIGLIGRV